MNSPRTGAASRIPDFIVHYSRGEPFRSITGAPFGDVSSILETLDETKAWGLARFSDPQYLDQRYRIEADLRKRFIDLGGQPVLEHPIYFFLGRNRRFEENKRNLGYLIPLRDLHPRRISFTYGDTMFCFHPENRRLAGEKYRNPLCENLYLVEDLPGLVNHPLFPKAEPLAIEAQLWTRPDPSKVQRLSGSEAFF